MVKASGILHIISFEANNPPLVIAYADANQCLPVINSKDFILLCHSMINEIEQNHLSFQK